MQEESFGPVVVLSPASDMTDVRHQLNSVPQGLVATLYSHAPAAQQQFRDTAEAGILHVNAGGAPIHPATPFGGWKTSGLGPPEHGGCDRDFYTRTQAIYTHVSP